MAEVGHQDLWQRATLAISLTAGTELGAASAADRVVRWLEERCPAGVRVDRAVVSLADLGF